MYIPPRGYTYHGQDTLLPCMHSLAPFRFLHIRASPTRGTDKGNGTSVAVKQLQYRIGSLSDTTGLFIHSYPSLFIANSLMYRGICYRSIHHVLKAFIQTFPPADLPYLSHLHSTRSIAHPLQRSTLQILRNLPISIQLDPYRCPIPLPASRPRSSRLSHSSRTKTACPDLLDRVPQAKFAMVMYLHLERFCYFVRV